jgi:hypothetical protein
MKGSEVKSALHQRMFEENEAERVVYHSGEDHLYIMHIVGCHGPLTNGAQVEKFKAVLWQRLLVP